MKGVSFALGEVAVFFMIASALGVAIGWVLRDWVFANKADHLDGLLRAERADYRRLEAAFASRERELERALAEQQRAVEALQSGNDGETIVLSRRPARPGAVIGPSAMEAVRAMRTGEPIQIDQSRDQAQEGVSSVANGPTAPPGHPDDFQQIRGIGPTLERRLHEEGVTTFRQLAALDEDQVALLADAIRLSRGRIVRDDWVGSALILDEETCGARR